ncbi:MAG: hypothetical protein IMF13_03560, partial [Proteobacteria bacterium]|nr:hypothetical protein [Pseudomonadota bacterium]
VQAGAIQAGPLLTVTGGPGPDAIKIQVGPVPGLVVLEGVPGIPDGQIYNGVGNIALSTYAGADDIKMYIESALVDVVMDTATDSDAVMIEMATPPNVANAVANFTFNTSTSDDSVDIKLESHASDFALNLNFDTGSGSDQVKVTLDQQVAGNVGINMNGTTGISCDTVDLVATGPAMFTVNGGVASEQIKVEIDGDAAGSIQLTGAAFANLEYIVKGSLTGSPGVFGSPFDDSLKLLVDGALLAGSAPILDGGAGIDSCDASPGVIVLNCE